MAKTKTKDEVAHDKISIPAAIRDKGGDKSASDLLAGLTAKAKKPEKKDAKKVHPLLPLSQDNQETFSRYAQVKQVYDVVEGELKAVKSEVNELLFDAWTDGLWIQKAWPASPAVKVLGPDGRVDAEALFIVQEKFPKLQIPDPDNPEESIVEGLTAPALAGDTTQPLSEADARRLVETELDFTPQLSLRSFSDLVDGHYVDRQKIEATPAEKAVGDKLMKFVTQNLTDEEQALILVNKPNTVVQKGVLTRLAGYLQSKEQLVLLFQYDVPVNYPKSAKFGVSDTPAERVKRLEATAKELIGAADLDAND